MLQLHHGHMCEGDEALAAGPVTAEMGIDMLITPPLQLQGAMGPVLMDAKRLSERSLEVASGVLRMQVIASALKVRAES